MKTPIFKSKRLVDNLAELYEAYEQFERNKYSALHDFDETFTSPKEYNWSAAESVIISLEKLFKDEKFVTEILKHQKWKVAIFKNIFKNPADYKKVIIHLLKYKYIENNGFLFDDQDNRYRKYKRKRRILDLKLFIKELSNSGFFDNNISVDIDNILIVSFSEKKKHPDTKFRKKIKNLPTFEGFDFTPTK